MSSSHKRTELKSGGQTLTLPGVCLRGESRQAARHHQRGLLSAAVPICLAFYKPRDWPQPRGPGRPQSLSSISQSQGGHFANCFPGGSSAEVLTRPAVEERNVSAAALSLRRVGGLGAWGARGGLVRVQGRCGAGRLRERGAPPPPALARA